MSELATVERLYPFVLRARKLVIGRENLFRKRGRIHFILITTDISANSYAEIAEAFRDIPIVQLYTAAEIEKFFQARNAKVLGFVKSTLSTSLYQILKVYEIKQPETFTKSPAVQKEENSN